LNQFSTTLYLWKDPGKIR